MSSTPCTRCDRPTDGATICWDCLTIWRAAIDKISDLMPELQVTIQREDLVSHGVRHYADHHSEDDVAVAAERILPARLRSRQGRIILAPHALPVNLAASEFACHVRRLIGDQITALAGDGERLDSRLATYALGPAAGPYCPPHVHTFNPDGCGLHPEQCKQLHPDHVHDYTPRGCGLDDHCEVPRWCWHESCIRIRAGKLGPNVACDWLRRHEKQLRQHPSAARMVDAADLVANYLERAVDSTDPDLYVGQCDAPDVSVNLDEAGTVVVAIPTGRICGAHLFARLGAQTVTCTACGYRYPIKQRLTWLIEAAREVWARPALIASALAGLDIELTSVKLNNWIHRDKACLESGRAVQDGDGAWWNPHTGLRLILQVGTDYQDDDGNDVMEPVVDHAGRPLVDDAGRPVLKQAGRAMYRIGDVLDRIDALRQQSTTRETRTA